VYDTRDYWVFGLCPTSCIPRNTKEPRFWKTGVSVLGWRGGRHLRTEKDPVSAALCSLQYRPMGKVQKPRSPQWWEVTSSNALQFSKSLGLIYDTHPFFCSFLSASISGPVNRFLHLSDISIWFFCGAGLSPLGTAATSGLFYKPQMTDEDDCGAVGGTKIGRGNRSTRRKLAPAPLCPPQIPHDLTRARTRAAAVGSQRLTAWAMARPQSGVSHLFSAFCIV
jgi:hypothetical protein